MKKKAAPLILLVLISIIPVYSIYRTSKIGKITIRVVDQNGNPLKGAVVQLTAITEPTNTTTSITILNKTTNARGEVTAKFKGALKIIAEKWERHLKGKPKIYTAIFVSVFYETEKGLYISDGWTINYNPQELKQGRHYLKLIKIDLTKPPTISKEKLENITKQEIHPTDFGPGLYIYAWKLEECKVYPEQGVGEIPIAWADARQHPQLRGHWISVSFSGSAVTKVSVGFYAGIALATGIVQGSARYTFKLGEAALSSYEIKFADGWYVKPNKFTWIYVKGQAAYEAWQLYKVSVTGVFPDVPLDEWKFQVYMRDLAINSEGEVLGGCYIDDVPPDSISYLYYNEGGMTYDYYGVYSGGSVYKIESWDLTDAYVKISGIPLELALPLGLVLASVLAETPLIISLVALAGLCISIVAEGDAECMGYIKFESSSGFSTRVYVGVTEFVYEYNTASATYYYHVPVLGFKLSSESSWDIYYTYTPSYSEVIPY